MAGDDRLDAPGLVDGYRSHGALVYTPLCSRARFGCSHQSLPTAFEITGQAPPSFTYHTGLADANLELIEHEAERQNKALPNCLVQTQLGDARDLHKIASNSIDLICTHPPYFNTLRYTESIDADLSTISNIDQFLDAIESIAGELLRTLRPGKTCAILMGDFRKKKRLYPLGWNVEMRFEKAGFELVDTIIKEQFNDSSMSFYLDGGSRITTHEYLFIFVKPTESA